MTGFYVPRKAGARETLGALAVALGVGCLSFYLVRMLLARDELQTKAPARLTKEPESHPGTKDQGAGR